MVQIQITPDYEIIKVTGQYPDEVSEAQAILASVPMTRPGSVWGLDGVAEYVADKHGTFTLNKSGISKRVAKSLIKQGKATILYR